MTTVSHSVMRLLSLLLVLLTAGTTTANAQLGEWSVERSAYYFGKSYQEPDTGIVRIINHGYYYRAITVRISQPGFAIVGDTVFNLPPQDTLEFRIAYDGINYPRAAATLYLTGDDRGGAMASLQGYNGAELTDLVVSSDLDLGAVPFDQKAEGSIEVRNRHSGQIKISKITFEKGKQSEFRFRYPPKLPIMIDSGRWDRFWIEFENTYPDLRRVTDRLLIELQLLPETRYYTRKITVSAGSLDCVELEREMTISGNGIYLGLNGSVLDSLKIVNPGSTPVAINSVRFDRPYSLQVLASFPLLVPAQDSTFVKIRWNAVGESEQNITGQLDLGDCGTEPFTIHALYAVRLFEDHDELLSIEDDRGQSAYPSFLFVNDDPDPILINSISFAGGEMARVQVSGISGFPLPLPSDSLMRLDLSIYPGNTGTVDDTLLIAINGRSEPLRYPLHAVLRGFSSMLKPGISSEVRISPNPGRSKFAVSLPEGRIISILVTDLLGRPIATLEDGEAIWDASSAPAGSYLIRVEGIKGGGSRFLETVRVVKE